MSRNTEREQRVIELMGRQQRRLRMAEQIIEAAGDAPRSDVIGALAAVLEAHTLPTTRREATAGRIAATLGAAGFAGADPDDVIAALAQVLHDLTAQVLHDLTVLRLADAYHQPPASQPTAPPTPIQSAEEASRQAATRGIAPAGDFEE